MQFMHLNADQRMNEKNAWKNNSGLNGIRTHDLCDTGAVLYQLSYQANYNCDLVIFWIRKLVYPWRWWDENETDIRNSYISTENERIDGYITNISEFWLVHMHCLRLLWLAKVITLVLIFTTFKWNR